MRIKIIFQVIRKVVEGLTLSLKTRSRSTPTGIDAKTFTSQSVQAMGSRVLVVLEPWATVVVTKTSRVGNL